MLVFHLIFTDPIAVINLISFILFFMSQYSIFTILNSNIIIILHKDIATCSNDNIAK